MSDIIRKLNKLKNPVSFLQINTIKGFKYVDKAGELINHYHLDDKIPQFRMDLNGLIISNPIEKIDEMKISSEVIWAKSTEVDSLDMVSRIFTNNAQTILSILEVDKISRIGWRNHFVFEFSNREKQVQFFQRLLSINNDNFKLGVINFKIMTDKIFEVNLLLQPVIKNDEKRTPGVLFDVDIYQTKDLQVDTIRQIFKNFRSYLSDSDGFLNIINQTFC